MTCTHHPTIPLRKKRKLHSRGIITPKQQSLGTKIKLPLTTRLHPLVIPNHPIPHLFLMMLCTLLLPPLLPALRQMGIFLQRSIKDRVRRLSLSRVG